VLDLAAGSGVWGIALAQSSGRVAVTAVDWGDVLPVTEKMVARFGLSERFSFVAGDLMEADFGHGHNVATLGHILHSEGEARSRTLLKKTFDDAKLPAEIEVYTGSQHGWCPPDSGVYNEPQAEKAWSRLLALYGKALA